MLPLLPRGVRTLILVGDYGSGKTEVAVNLALVLGHAASEGLDDAGRSVAIADLDLVNPYFRCREAEEPIEAAGVRLVIPRREGQRFADLPILLPEVRGLLQDEHTLAILDVGGDEVGARVLAGLASDAGREGVELWFVANARRPFEDTAAGCTRAARRIEGATGLRVTGLVSNTHLMDETTPEMVLEGLALAAEAAATLGVPVRLLAAMEPLAVALRAGADPLPCPVLAMRRLMVPPWVRRAPVDRALRLLQRGQRGA
jgi:hypothetical protein